MNELTMLANVAEIIGVLIVIGGLFFAAMQLRQFRQQRRELAAIELFRFFGNPYFTSAYKTILWLPDELDVNGVRDAGPDVEDAAMLISATMENIGVMTFQRIVPFTVVYHLMGSTTPVLWRKLERWAQAHRTELNSSGAFEWFQWLAERMEEYDAFDDDPAYIAYTSWTPSHLKHQIGS